MKHSKPTKSILAVLAILLVLMVTLPAFAASGRGTGASDSAAVPGQETAPAAPAESASGEHPDAGDPAARASVFTDVKETDWFARAVSYVCGHQLMNGVGGQRFAPQSEVTRAMAVTVLWRVAEPEQAIPSDNQLVICYASPAYSDVEADAWYEDAVQWAKARGIVQGYGDGTFGPDHPVTREQLAVMLCNFDEKMQYGLAAEPPASPGDPQDWDDVSDWALDAMIWAFYESNLLQGDGAGHLHPLSTLTRAELAQILQRVHASLEALQAQGQTPAPFALVAADGERTFADSLTRQAATGESSARNWCISPYSMEMCLAMLANGAQGKTQEELLHALGIEDLQKYNEETKALLEQYDRFQKIMRLETANSIWLNQDTFDGKGRFLKPFRTLLETFFRAEAQEVTDADSIERVNTWADEKTHGRIPSILTEEHRSFATAVANAVYFKAAWEDEFAEGATRDDTFYNADGTQTALPFMRQQDSMPYFEADGIQAVALDYKSSYASDSQGSDFQYFPDADFSMYLIKSDQDIDPQHFLEQAEFQSEQVNLQVPKFTVEYGASFNDALRALGVREAYVPDRADFSSMVDLSQLPGGALYLEDVLQKTFIKIDEQGTEAAAVTVAVEAAGAARPSHRVVEFKADHPFWFVIRDNSRDQILFVGRYNCAE